MENGPARQQHRLPQDERAVRTKAWLNKALLSSLAGRRSQIEMRDWFNFCFGGGERGRRRQRGIDCPIPPSPFFSSSPVLANLLLRRRLN